MKIDPRIPSTVETQNGQVKAANTAATKAQSPERAASAATVPSGDTFALSQKHGEIQQLSVQLASVPEVRTEKVAPLQAQVKSGNYKPSPVKTADAILAEQTRKSAKA
jgi:flagellar biosynthesis anti-sigma factor FlgM